MSYSATFIDGPMELSRHEFMGVDDPYQDLYAVPNPGGRIEPWLIVGYTGLEPDEPWPDQVHYHLTGVAVMGGETFADYSVEKPVFAP